MTPDHVRGRLSSDAGVTSSSIISPTIPSPISTLSTAPFMMLSPASTTSDNLIHRRSPYGLLSATFKPQAFAVAVVRQVMLAKRRIALPRPITQPGHIMPDKLARVLVVADEAVESIDVLVQPDRVEVVATQIPERIDREARFIRKAANPALFCGREELVREVRTLERLLESFIRRRRILPLHVAGLGFGLLDPPALLPSVSTIPYFTCSSRKYRSSSS